MSAVLRPLRPEEMAGKAEAVTVGDFREFAFFEEFGDLIDCGAAEGVALARDEAGVGEAY